MIQILIVRLYFYPYDSFMDNTSTFCPSQVNHLPSWICINHLVLWTFSHWSGHGSSSEVGGGEPAVISGRREVGHHHPQPRGVPGAAGQIQIQAGHHHPQPGGVPGAAGQVRTQVGHHHPQPGGVPGAGGQVRTQAGHHLLVHVVYRTKQSKLDSLLKEKLLG